MMKVYLISQEAIQLSSKVSVPFCILTSSLWDSLFSIPIPSVHYLYSSASLSAFDIVSVLDLCHFNRCVIVSHCCFNLDFPDSIWCGISFHISYLLSLYYIWWDICLDLLPIFYMNSVFLLLRFKNFLYVLEIILYQLCLLQVLSYNLWLVFSFFASNFAKAEVFNFNEAQVVISFINYVFGIISRSHHQTQDHLDFLLFYLLWFLYFCILHLGLLFILT